MVLKETKRCFYFLLSRRKDWRTIIVEGGASKPAFEDPNSSVQLLSHVLLFATLWTAARQDSLSITSSRSLSKLLSIESVMPSNHLIHCCPLLVLPSIFPSLRVFRPSIFCGQTAGMRNQWLVSCGFIYQVWAHRLCGACWQRILNGMQASNTEDGREGCSGGISLRTDQGRDCWHEYIFCASGADWFVRCIHYWV